MYELNLTGLWWLASKPNEKVGGTLVFEPIGGAKLTLIGALGGLDAMTDQGTIGTVYGLADNKIVTILGAYTIRLGTNIPGPHKHILGAARSIVGAHLDNSDLSFNRVDIDLDYLPEFINHSSLVTNLGRSESGNWTGLKAEVATQSPLRVGRVNGGEASIRFGWGQSGDNLRSLTLRERYSFTIEFKESHNIHKILSEYVWPIQDFVTMATDKPNAIAGLSLENPLLLASSPRPRPLTLEVFERSRVKPERKPNESLMRPYMLFTLQDLKSNQLNKWLKVSDYYKPVVGILFGQRYLRGIGIENLLLNAVSAVEAFHRRRFANTVLTESEWKAKKKRLMNDVEESEVAFLNEVLQYANEKRLRTRLEEVLQYSGVRKDLVGNSVEWNNQIRNYRNILTHYDPDAPQEIKDYEPLYWLSESLSWVMLACLMIETGFGKREVLKLLKNNERYKFARTRLHKILNVN